MAVVRRFAVAGLDEAARRSGRRRGLVIGALDETGQCKHGAMTAGVKRQYLGCAGKVANGINTVHLSYVRARTGHALIGARQWIPAEHISDPAKAMAMGLPEGLVFRTRGQLAIDICAGAFTGGVRFDFVCGDEVYGNSSELRESCEDHGQAPPPARPGQRPPPDPGMVPLTVAEIKRLAAPPASPRTEQRVNWCRRHQARSRWYHQRARLARNTTIAQVS